ncbi:hypothetical protein AB0D60_03090 [Streptomyces sp. NPDC048306]|uniref:hypothetical protein n=1 Tax=Streptomyces sp. NPDC048306 TaxID=3154502 RepID=UPI0033D80202
MTNPNPPVTGPFRISVEPIPTGVTLDVGSFVEHVVHDVVEALLRDSSLGERFDALLDAQPQQDPHRPERQLPFEELVADLVAVAGTRVPVYGLQALRLAGWIERCAAPAVEALQALGKAEEIALASIMRGEGGAAA